MPRKKKAPAAAAAASNAAAGAHPEALDADKSVKKELNPIGFQKLIDGYKNQDGTKLYINRVWPVIDRSLTGNYNYLDKQEFPYPENLVEWIPQKWGGGVYQAYFNDKNRPTKTREVARCIFSTERPGCGPAFDPVQNEPVIDYRELVRGPEKNEQFIQRLLARGKIFIDDKGGVQPVIPGQTGPGGGTKEVLDFAREVMHQEGGGGTAVNKSIDLISSTATAVVKNVLEMGSKNAGVDGLAILEKVEKILEKREDKGQGALVGSLIEQNNKLMLALIELKSGGGHSRRDDSNLDTAMQYFEKISGFAEKFGVNMPKPAGGLTGLLDSLMEKAPQLLTMWLMFKAGAAPGAAGAELGGLTPTPAAGMVAGTTTPAAVAAATATASNGATPAADANAAAMQQRMLQLHSLGMRVADCINRQIPGEDLAVSVVTFHGMGTYREICNIGRQDLLEGFKLFPDVWSKVSGLLPQLELFVDQFLDTYKEEETTPDGPPAATTDAAVN